MVFDLSGTTKSGSMPITLPYPPHVGHAPKGLLKSNRCSVGSTNVIPSASKRCENVIILDSLPSLVEADLQPAGRSSAKQSISGNSIAKRHSPLPSKNAVCTESAKRFSVLSSPSAMRRSTKRYVAPFADKRVELLSNEEIRNVSPIPSSLIR